MNILFSINRSFVPLLESCLRSIVKNGGAEAYSVYVMHSDLLPGDIHKLTAAFGKTVEFHFIYVDEEMFSGFPEFNRYPRQIYYRLAAPLLLPEELDRILYLDVDTVVINSLIPLYTDSFDGNCIMACTHTRKFLTKFNQLRLKAGSNAVYVNSGVMMLSLDILRNEFSLEKICRYTHENKDRLLLPDQDILTALYGDRVKVLDSLTYNLSDRTLNLYNADPSNEKIDLEWVRKHSVVIHYFGHNKPWRENYHGILDVFYRENMEAQSETYESSGK